MPKNNQSNLPKHKNKASKSGQVPLRVSAFFYEMKRLNNSPHIEFKEERPFNTGASIKFTVLKKHTFKHKLMPITHGTTALYRVPNKKQSVLPKAGTTTAISGVYSACECAALNYTNYIIPVPTNTITVNGPNGTEQTMGLFSVDNNTLEIAGTVPQITTTISPTNNDTQAIFCTNSTAFLDNFGQYNNYPIQIAPGCTCGDPTDPFYGGDLTCSPSVSAYDAAVGLARQTNGFVTVSLPKGNYRLTGYGNGFV